MLKIFLLLSLICQTSAMAAGWVFWEMGDLVRTPSNEKTVISAKTILPEISLYTDKTQRKEKLEIDFIFSAKQGEIDGIMSELNWYKLNTDFKKAFFLTVKDLIAGKNSTHFPPAIKYHLNKKIQDLSYGKIINHQRIEFYVWRLPYRTKDFIPLWAAAYSGTLLRQGYGRARKAWQPGTEAARRLKSNTKQPSKTTGDKTENKTTFISSLKKISTLKTMELRHPNRNKNIILIKKIR